MPKEPGLWRKGTRADGLGPARLPVVGAHGLATLAGMSSDDLLPAALALSVKERAKLARDLLESLREVDEGDVEGAWIEEIDRRAEQVENGTAKLVDWESARDEIAGRLKARR